MLKSAGQPVTSAALADLESAPRQLTLVVTASGFAMAGIGSAFWGLVAGVAAVLLEAGLARWRQR